MPLPSSSIELPMVELPPAALCRPLRLGVRVRERSLRIVWL